MNHEEPARLKQIGTITIRKPAGTFVATEYFQGPTFNISSRNDNFRKHFLPKVEENNESVAEELIVSILLEDTDDYAIITALGGEAQIELTLTEFFAAFAKWAMVEDDSLLKSGLANVGYIRDLDGVLWAVYGFWRGGGWHFAATLENPNRWVNGCKFLSRRFFLP